jgi:arginine/lysine/ornithine decarboxylase
MIGVRGTGCATRFFTNTLEYSIETSTFYDIFASNDNQQQYIGKESQTYTINNTLHDLKVWVDYSHLDMITLKQ